MIDIVMLTNNANKKETFISLWNNPKSDTCLMIVQADIGVDTNICYAKRGRAANLVPYFLWRIDWHLCTIAVGRQKMRASKRKRKMEENAKKKCEKMQLGKVR